jgi:hypothetical protein
MILRSVTKHVKDQNWFAVFIDFFIVVVGVFVGIQVSNWNESRTDNMRAKGYLERIINNLETDEENYLYRMEFWEQVSDFGLTVLQYSETQDKGQQSHWDILLAFFQASQIASFYTTSTTYDELTSAGELGLIRNLGVRNMISDYYTDSDNPALVERPIYRENVRGIIPINVQNYIWNTCFKTDITLDQVLIKCQSPISVSKAEEIVNQLSSNQQLLRELRYWMSTMRVVILVAKNQLESGKQLIQTIQTELNSNQPND